MSGEKLAAIELEHRLAACEAVNKRYKDALEFYADPMNWHENGYDNEPGIITSEDVDEITYKNPNYNNRDYTDLVGGKLARKALDGA